QPSVGQKMSVLRWTMIFTLLDCLQQYEEVGGRTSGERFIAVPVHEFRGALVRPFESKNFDLGLNVFIVSGFGGQTLETLALPGEGAPFEQITGFPLKSYVSASWTYYFRHR